MQAPLCVQPASYETVIEGWYQLPLDSAPSPLFRQALIGLREGYLNMLTASQWLPLDDRALETHTYRMLLIWNQIGWYEEELRELLKSADTTTLFYQQMRELEVLIVQSRTIDLIPTERETAANRYFHSLERLLVA